MDIQNTDDLYENAFQEAEKYYREIGRVWCPALNEYINFNQAGFEHLMRRRMKWRLKSDQMRRFKLLKYAKNIVCSEESILVTKNEKIFPRLAQDFGHLPKRQIIGSS